MKALQSKLEHYGIHLWNLRVLVRLNHKDKAFIKSQRIDRVHSSGFKLLQKPKAACLRFIPGESRQSDDSSEEAKIQETQE